MDSLQNNQKPQEVQDQAGNIPESTPNTQDINEKSKQNPGQTNPQGDGQKTADKIANDLGQGMVGQQLQTMGQQTNVQSVTKPAAKSSDPYIEAAEAIMKKDKDDPYQEDRDHKDIQKQYLTDRFGKN